ncbi:MAG TPA: MarR family transcriptional regulator [Burkholderiales bacterium]|nr:MarR family transcriptional regulator [Burkholderiales bacterium]
MPRHPSLLAGGKGDRITKPDRLAHLTKEAWRAFVRDLQRRLAAHGVSFGHWTFLRILWARDGLTQRELSQQAGVMEPSTHAALKAMERLGYVKRRQLPGNRKTVYVHLTAKGRALERRLVPLAKATNRAAVRGLPAPDVAAAKRVLIAVTQNLTTLTGRPADICHESRSRRATT